MQTKRLWTLVALLAVMATALSACSINMDRNDDGSLNREVHMDEAAIQSELRLAITDPLVQDLTVELHDGYVEVYGERQRVMSHQVDSLSFRLDLAVSAGHLTAEISEAQLNGRPIAAERVAAWNEHIAIRLERAGKRHPDSSLQSVSTTEDALTMAWRVETWLSRD